MRSRLILLPLVLALSSVTSVARAAAPTDAALAQVLFTSGKEAMARGDLATACGRFAESLKLDPAVGTRLNLATCEERSGRLAIALDHFTAVRALLPKDDFRVAFTTERIDHLSRRVARVVVQLTIPRAAGTRVLRDGLEMTSFDGPVTLDPGPHAFVVEVSGQPAERTALTLREGEERVLELPRRKSDREPSTAAASPAPASTPPLPVSAPEEKDKRTDGAAGSRRTWAFVTGGVGVAGLVTGAVTGIVALNAASTYRDHCVNGVCDADGLSAASTGRSVRLISPIAFAVGAAFGVASVYLFLSEPKSSASAARRRGERKTAMAAFTGLSFGVGHVSLAGTF